MFTMTRSNSRELAAGIALGALLAGCSHGPVSFDQDRVRTADSVRKLGLAIAEPRADEVVIVINQNRMQVHHAGMFVGTRLSDPAGTYEHARAAEQDWKGVTLDDYVRFQLEDGDRIKLYRFTLTPDSFAAIEARVANVGFDLPLFCAAGVENRIAGIGPFSTIASVWWISPTGLAERLDPLVIGHSAVGSCLWPNGMPCSSGEPAITMQATVSREPSASGATPVPGKPVSAAGYFFEAPI
jgi:hypothetical protein